VRRTSKAVIAAAFFLVTTLPVAASAVTRQTVDLRALAKAAAQEIGRGQARAASPEQIAHLSKLAAAFLKADAQRKTFVVTNKEKTPEDWDLQMKGLRLIARMLLDRQALRSSCMMNKYSATQMTIAPCGSVVTSGKPALISSQTLAAE